MLNDGTAEDAGINAPEEVTLESEDQSTPEVTEEMQDTPKKWIPKVLAKNKVLKQENEELKAQLKELARQAATEVVDEKDAKKQFVTEHWEDALKDVEEVLKVYPNLNYADAHAVAQRHQKNYAIQWNVPQSITDPESKPLSIAELKVQLEKEFAEGKLHI